jgi:NAD(P)-dependent dehydrogenase (short-subunit alcohol dehydrogenase family)
MNRRLRTARKPRADETRVSREGGLPMQTQKPLEGQVAVVAGATRGAGRGIARGLGEAGAIVYCTGRSVRGEPSAYGRPETIEETAELVTAAGGTGIAVRVDHTSDTEVRALFARVEREQKRLDVLVNGIAGEDPIQGKWSAFLKTDLANAEAAYRQCVVSHVRTAQLAAPMMIRAKRGLIVEVTEHDMLFGGGNAVSQIHKLALKGIAVFLAEELYKHKVTAIAITPGFLRSESMLEHFGVTEANWRDAAKKDKNFLLSETPLFIGRAVAALAADPKVFARTGDLLSSWDVAKDYGVTDIDGRRPDWGSHFITIAGQYGFIEPMRRHVAWLDKLSARTTRYLGDDATPARRKTTRAAKAAR